MEAKVGLGSAPPVAMEVMLLAQSVEMVEAWSEVMGGRVSILAVKDTAEEKQVKEEVMD